jgi:hypothetical protein
MQQNKKTTGDPRVAAFEEIINTPMFEHFSAQVTGDVVSVGGGTVVIKRGEDEVILLINKDVPIAVSKTTVTKDGDKKAEFISLSEIKKGKHVKANVSMLPSGDWEIIGLNVREREEDK